MVNLYLNLIIRLGQLFKVGQIALSEFPPAVSMK